MALDKVPVVCSCGGGNEPSDSMRERERGDIWPAERLSDSQEGFCSMVLFTVNCKMYTESRDLKQTARRKEIETYFSFMRNEPKTRDTQEKLTSCSHQVGSFSIQITRLSCSLRMRLVPVLKSVFILEITINS
jgi:hypothetical protein